MTSRAKTTKLVVGGVTGAAATIATGGTFGVTPALTLAGLAGGRIGIQEIYELLSEKAIGRAIDKKIKSTENLSKRLQELEKTLKEYTNTRADAIKGPQYSQVL